MDGVHKVRHKLPETMLYSWCIWPVWVVCLYGIIPKYIRAPADNMFDAMWAVFFSWLQHRDLGKDDECDECDDH